jgi:hypothetical protein
MKRKNNTNGTGLDNTNGTRLDNIKEQRPQTPDNSSLRAPENYVPATPDKKDPGVRFRLAYPQKEKHPDITCIQKPVNRRLF